MSKISTAFGRFFFVCVLCSAAPAHATLGQPAMSAQFVQTQAGITQYANAAGIVYAVTWQTRTPVDVQSLLGSYAAQFDAARNPRAGLNAPMVLNTPHFVAHVFQTPGHWFGLAYIPALVPAGVNPESLK